MKTENKFSKRSKYKWILVVMLWFICFFNYADRQAIFSVFPLLQKELHLSDLQLGLLGSAFMWVYALSAPFAGHIGDLTKRKKVILGGLYLWSAVTYLTALSTKLWQLITFRATEGFGESFYYPASVSMISDYHGKSTRSRALSLHQSSVYIGTIGGGALAGFFGERYGWRSSFYVLGAFGILLGLLLMKFIIEPKRGQTEVEEIKLTHGFKVPVVPGNRFQELSSAKKIVEAKTNMLESVKEILNIPTALILMGVFFGANFVAMVFLTWMPSFLFEKFHMSLTLSGVTATVFIQTASIIGVLVGGGLADFLSKQKTGGRMITQTIGLFFGAPFIFLTGWTFSIPILIFAMTGFGFFKGMYDANIFASVFDVVRPEIRATASGVMNMVGWLGGGVAPLVIGIASSKIGMSRAIASTSVVYVMVGIIILFGVLKFVKKDAERLNTIIALQQVKV